MLLDIRFPISLHAIGAALAVLESPTDPNIPLGSVNLVIDAFYFAEELVDCQNEDSIEVVLRDLLLRLVKKTFCA